MRDNLVKCQLRQHSLNAKQETGPGDLHLRGTINSSHVGTVPATFQGQVPIFSFKANHPLHSHTPPVRQLHRKVVSAFSKSHNDPRKKQSAGQKDYESEKSLGKHIRSRSFACHGTIQKIHPRDTVPAVMTATLSVDDGMKSTFLRRRLTPEFTSIRDLQARFHSKSHLHQELDQLVKARSVASTHSIPGATIRDPHGATLSPFVEADDEDSEIQSDVSSAIEITDSSARSQKLFHYLRSANKLSQLSPRTDLQVHKTDSCPFAGFESQHSVDNTTILVDGVVTMENVDLSDETGMNIADRQASLPRMAPSSTVLDGRKEHEKDSIVFCDSSDRHNRLLDDIETPEEAPNPSSTRLGELGESQMKEVNHCATSIIVDGLVNPVTPMVATGNVEHVRSNDEEENEGWVSFGGFYETPMANATATDESNKPAPRKPAHQSRSKEEAKPPLLPIETGSKVIIDLSGTNSEFNELIVHMNSGDVSELTDFDFPDVSKASHPVDQDTQQRLTTSDIIRLSRKRLIEKRRSKHENLEQPRVQEEGYVDPPKTKSGVPKADSPPGLFTRPSSTPFQNKAQDGSITGITLAPRSVLRRSSFCGSNQSDTLPFAVRGTTDSTRETQVAIVSPLSAPPISKGKKDTPVVMADASSMNPVAPTGVSSDEEDDDDPLSRLQCLTRIAI